jgi:hypothetical protein
MNARAAPTKAAAYSAISMSSHRCHSYDRSTLIATASTADFHGFDLSCLTNENTLDDDLP